MALQTGIFSELIDQERKRQADESRSSLENPQTPLSYPAEWLLDLFNGGRTDSGIRISEFTAFQVTTFLACVDLIAGSIAALPLHVYERSIIANGRAVHKVAYGHEYYDLLHNEPNNEMSRFTFIKTLMAHALAWGNGYSELQRDGSNGIVGIWPRNPTNTRPFRLSQAIRLNAVPWRPFPVTIPAGAMVYKTSDAIDYQDQSDTDSSSSTGDRIIPMEDVIHIPGLSLDGRLGQSVVWLSREILGMALATTKYGAKYFANFARPSGILESPALSPEAREKAKQSWQEAQGGENAHRVAVMPPGFKFTPMANNPEESQTIQTREFIKKEVCSLFHVSPHMVGDIDKGRSNTEQLAQEYISYTLRPWLVALKQEFKRKMFPNTGVGRTPKSRFYVDFDLNDLLRPDSASREKFYATGRSTASLNTNDIREFEKLNPIDEPWAEQYWMPINMTLATTPLDPSNQDGAGKGEPTHKAEPGKDDQESKRLISAFSRLFRDAFKRILGRDNPDLRDFNQAFGPVLWSLADLFAQELRSSAGQETDRFIAGYLGGMVKRKNRWSDSDECSRDELQRAIRAVRIAVFRDVATREALELNAIEEEEGATV